MDYFYQPRLLLPRMGILDSLENRAEPKVLGSTPAFCACTKSYKLLHCGGAAAALLYPYDPLCLLRSSLTGAIIMPRTPNDH